MSQTERPPSILKCMEASRLWRDQFAAPTWQPWRAFLAALFGLEMTEEQAALYRQCTGRTTLPSQPFSEATIVAGGRSGKSRMLALIATYLAAGELATVGCIFVDRAQARTLIRYCRGLLDCVPQLAALVEGEHSQRITLPSRRVVIEVQTASFQMTRGYSFAAILYDELALSRCASSGSDAASPSCRCGSVHYVAWAPGRSRLARSHFARFAAAS